MAFIENLGWTNINSVRAYPIREGLSQTDVTGVFQIPNNFIVDAQLACTSDVSTDFYISQLSNQINQIVITISDSSSVIVGSFVIPTSGFNSNSSYALQTVPGSYQYANGKLVVGAVTSIQNSPVGIFEFLITATQLEPRTVILSQSNINTITFLDSVGTFQTLSGNVSIVVRDNLRWSYDGTSIILDAGDGLGLNTVCTTAPAVLSINGVTPDENGNLNFIGVGCSTISTTTAATLLIDDQCASPCASCDSLVEMTSRVNELESKYQSLNNLYQTLSVGLTTYLGTINNSSCSC